VPERQWCFYRVGFYDNVTGADRMSLYVEIGLRRDADADPETWLPRVLDDLRRCRIVHDQQLVAWHAEVLDPAYVHIHRAGQRDAATRRAALAAQGIHAVGRYGGWRYCAIEDNIVEARALARALAAR